MKHNDLEINRLIERLENLGILVDKIESSGFGSMLNFEMSYQSNSNLLIVKNNRNYLKLKTNSH